MHHEPTPFIGRLARVFSAGVVGALANSLTAWLFGVIGLSAALGVAIAPALTPGWLYPRLIWGGLWGLLFVVIPAAQTTWLKGLLLSLGPTLVQLLVVFPEKAQKGYFGLELGALTPVFVVVFNAVWGIVAVMVIRAAADRPTHT